MVQVKEEPSTNETITEDDIEMFSTDDVGNNVTICHDADIDIKVEGNSDQSQPEVESNINFG